MKKKILSGIFALALPVTAGYGVNQSTNYNRLIFSELTLANIEALAQLEDGYDECHLVLYYMDNFCFFIRKL
jgi:hypothetical protein